MKILSYFVEASPNQKLVAPDTSENGGGDRAKAENQLLVWPPGGLPKSKQQAKSLTLTRRTLKVYSPNRDKQKNSLGWEMRVGGWEAY